MQDVAVNSFKCIFGYCDTIQVLRSRARYKGTYESLSQLMLWGAQIWSTCLFYLLFLFFSPYRNTYWYIAVNNLNDVFE